VRPAFEVVGILLIVAGLAAAWVPLGLVAAGAAFVLAAHAEIPAKAPATPLRRDRAA
jgi:uncharacterized protein (DUF111 family)